MVALLHPHVLWRTTYWVMCALGAFREKIFLSALLLDWLALDSVTGDLVKAIFYPAKQLGATFAIVLIVLNICSVVEFKYYRTAVNTGLNIYSMWESLKFSISFGLRGEYGIDHEMSRTLSNRLIFDVIFYIVVCPNFIS
jgi:hypothetical protein